MTTRLLSVFLPLLPTDRLARPGSRSAGRRPADGPPGSAPPGSAPPLVTTAKVKGAQRIAAADAAAARAGIRPGMALADARALSPALLAVEADRAAERATLGRIGDWCGRFTPLVALDGPDGLLLDIGGSAHLFGGESALLDHVRTGLARQGFAAQVAVAGTPEAAWALARFGASAIAPSPDEGGFARLMSDLPTAALRLDRDTVSALARAGLRRLGDLLQRPRGPIAARFGETVFARLDGLMGAAKSPVSPRFAAPLFMAERRFASGVVAIAAIEAALLPLSRHLCTALASAGNGARRLEATLFRVDGAVRRIGVGTSRPTRDAEALVRLFRERLAAIGEDGLDTGYGFDLIRLTVVAAEPLAPRQDGLPVSSEPGSGEPGPADLGDLADRLGARLGPNRVLRLEDRGSHRPEGAMGTRPVSETPPAPAPDSGDPGFAGDDMACRPIRLFARPEPIDTIAAVPDGPPVRFRWRRLTHEIAAIEGPERIAPEWWTQDAGLTRDYFRAEDGQGRRFWLYREGLFNREVDQARWFLHGLFG